MARSLRRRRLRRNPPVTQRISIPACPSPPQRASLLVRDLLPSRSAIAALVAEVIWSDGISLWNDLLPSITLLSKRGPVEAEFVAFILKWISESRIACTMDLEVALLGGQCEAGLYGLDDVLPNIMLLLSSLLKKHDEATLAEHSDQLIVSTEKHVLTVTAGLQAANAYAKWVLVVHLAKHGLIERCESLLHLSNFRIHALQFFKILSKRRRPDSVEKDYDTAMIHVFWILMSISQDVLTKYNACSNFLSESQLDFAEGICECLVDLGSFNMQCIIADGIRTSRFLKQMMEYYQHYNIALHFRCLPFWLMVLELPKEKFVASDPGDVASISGANSAEKGSIEALFFVSDDICSVILDVSFKRMIKTSATTSLDSSELWSDELHGVDGFIQYRSRLLDLIRLIAYRRPTVAANRVAQRIDSVLGNAGAVSKSPKDLAAFESAHLELKAVVDAIFDDSVKNAENILSTEPLLHRIFEGLLMQLLSLKWTEPSLVAILGHYFSALCPYLRCCPNAVVMVVNKLFDLLSSISVNYHDPSTAQNARLQICSCLIHIRRAIDGTALPSDVKDFFSCQYVTEEEVLTFGALNRTSYSVDQNQGLALLVLLSWNIFPISSVAVWMSLSPNKAACSRTSQYVYKYNLDSSVFKPLYGRRLCVQQVKGNQLGSAGG